MCPNHTASKLQRWNWKLSFHSQFSDNEEERSLHNALPNVSLKMASQREPNLLVRCQNRWYHNFTPVITFGPHSSIRQGEQATEDQGFHEQSYLVSNSDSTNSGAHSNLGKFFTLSSIDLKKCKCVYVYIIDYKVSVTECNVRV